MRRVVVTGLGVVAPAGIGVDAFWKQITHGVSAVGRITKFDPAGLPSQIAAEVNGFDPEAYLPRRDVVRTDTFIHFALTAAQQALADAKLEVAVNGAEVDLKGTVKSDAQRRRATEIVETTAGVQAVNDGLKVEE